ncbi:hypothetical protein [Noviherbaspirillum aerium]|uniref:hypothetical protein n=1 Tax=Noviherbaspirillum aerium TaxID=2588497 RepID=UPI00124C6CF0|nr:hypothetical protein [Noviherbaspirillum aerium]
MGILGTLIGKREPEVTYRTIDGGHPAPYPDMTDEQLYNYEMTFNVPRRTFDKPPMPSRPKEEEVTIRREPRMTERPAPHDAPTASASAASAASFAPAASTANAATASVASSTPAPGKNFDAPRYTARAPREAETMPRPAEAPQGTSAQLQPTQIPPTQMPAPLDFSKPVRLITTKQTVEIITTRARHPVYKVHGYIGDDDVVTVFTLDGRLSENGLRYLENVPQQHQLYVNVYANTDLLSRDRYLLTQHESREDADAAAQPGRLACVAVELDK